MAVESITLRHGDVVAEVVPARGALVSRLQVGPTDVLFMDRTTLEDPSKSVRGGIPILFPFAGRLVQDTLVHAGSVMKQHGFGRNRAWAVGERLDHKVTLILQPDVETRAVYPHEFTVEQTVMLLPRGLNVEMLVTNRGSRVMPVSPGWHPYFNCPAKQKGAVKCDAAGFPPEKFVDDVEFDFGITAPANGRARFEVPGMGKMTLSFSPEMRFLQFWSLPGRDFVCLEPFYGPNNTINTEKRAEIAPGESRVFWMRIEV
ncbi:MAG: hypothetical protein AB2A00_00745 [Myxococcota bacterium]